MSIELLLCFPMIPVIGNLSLYLVLIFSFLGIIASGTKFKLYKIKLFAMFIFVAICTSFYCLIYSYIVSDFSVLNVYMNSHTTKPMIYKISGAWGNHEGSMLLWLFAMSLFGLLFSFFAQCTDDLKRYTICIQFALISIFTVYVINISNPFERVFPAPLEGRGLNAILQDVGLAMHPPVLYLGYVGFSLAYSFVIALLLTGKAQDRWHDHLKPWVVLSWFFLTAGISLGSWWAYRELGWGGYWYWDPVENASLMPWLFATALIHSLIATGKEKFFERQSIVLSVFTFILTMLGTFIVRSGAVTSVHSFAVDPTRGTAILAIIAGLFFFALFAYSLRFRTLAVVGKVKLFSKSSVILANNLLIATMGLVVMLGTLYPIFLEFFTGIYISVGSSYYNTVLAPISILLVGFCIISSQFGVHKISRKQLILKMLAIVFISALLLLLIATTFKIYTPLNIIAIFISIFLVMSVVEHESHAFIKLDYRRLSMTLGHIGFGLLILAIAVNTGGKKEHEFVLEPGKIAAIHDYQIKLEDVLILKAKNFVGKQALISVKNRFTKEIVNVKPEIRFYPAENQQTVESSTYHHPLYDLYFVMGDVQGDGIQFKLFYQPMIGLLWLSCILISLSGMFNLVYHINSRIFST